MEGSYGGVWGKAMEKDDHVLLFGWDDPKVRPLQELAHDSYLTFVDSTTALWSR